MLGNGASCARRMCELLLLPMAHFDLKWYLLLHVGDEILLLSELVVVYVFFV